MAGQFAVLCSWVQILRVKFQSMPCFGHMLTCRPVDYWNAGIEYLHALVWSTMPFWLGALVIFMQQSTGDAQLLDVLTDTFRNGELLVFTISTLTPITYFTLFEASGKSFPHRLGIGTITIILIISSASLFALQKGKVQLKQEDLFTLSLTLASAAILWRYIAVLYNRTQIPKIAEKDFTASSEALFNNFNAELDNSLTNSTTTEPKFGAQQNNFSDAFNAATEPIATSQNGTVYMQHPKDQEQE